MLSDTQISRLLDVANAACHGGNVVDARAMYAGVLALRPGFAHSLTAEETAEMPPLSEQPLTSKRGSRVPFVKGRR